ncbi:collagen alpha-1(III) chain-like [Tachyglossus aculeatus]|uniref:collagen alpha-1(III) chain-like n=1 Tax=Tachyglossus aculeatus TaxID=9261 RepID=UPI0018F5857A|nr:collagen alpha-1(III) chain-like [Tachyglossus aculeatus]
MGGWGGGGGGQSQPISSQDLSASPARETGGRRQPISSSDLGASPARGRGVAGVGGRGGTEAANQQSGAGREPRPRKMGGWGGGGGVQSQPISSQDLSASPARGGKGGGGGTESANQQPGSEREPRPRERGTEAANQQPGSGRELSPEPSCGGKGRRPPRPAVQSRATPALTSPFPPPHATLIPRRLPARAAHFGADQSAGVRAGPPANGGRRSRRGLPPTNQRASGPGRQPMGGKGAPAVYAIPADQSAGVPAGPPANGGRRSPRGLRNPGGLLPLCPSRPISAARPAPPSNPEPRRL